MDKIWFKIIMFVIVIGGLALVGFKYMRDNNIDERKLTAKDIVKIYDTSVISEDIDYIEIQIEEDDREGIKYSEPVKVSDKNDISYLRNELNNCEKIDDENTFKGAGYDGCPLVTFYMKDNTKLYVGVATSEDSAEFFVAKNEDYGDKENYKLLANDQIDQYVENLYNKYNVGTNENTNTNANTNTTSVSNTNAVNSLH